MDSKDSVKVHLIKAMAASLAESNGDEDMARQLAAEVKLSLICMSDEDLWELSGFTTDKIMEPIEVVYRKHKQRVNELCKTAGDWVGDLLIYSGKPYNDNYREINVALHKGGMLIENTYKSDRSPGKKDTSLKE